MPLHRYIKLFPLIAKDFKISKHFICKTIASGYDVNLVGNEHEIKKSFDKFGCTLYDIITVSKTQLNIELRISITIKENLNNMEVTTQDRYNKIFEETEKIIIKKFSNNNLTKQHYNNDSKVKFWDKYMSVQLNKPRMHFSLKLTKRRLTIELQNY